MFLGMKRESFLWLRTGTEKESKLHEELLLVFLLDLLLLVGQLQIHCHLLLLSFSEILISVLDFLEVRKPSLLRLELLIASTPLVLGHGLILNLVYLVCLQSDSLALVQFEQLLGIFDHLWLERRLNDLSFHDGSSAVHLRLFSLLVTHHQVQLCSLTKFGLSPSHDIVQSLIPSSDNLFLLNRFL